MIALASNLPDWNALHFLRPEWLWALLALNVLALLAWEFAAARGCVWLRRWGARLIATASGFAATAIAPAPLFDTFCAAEIM